MKQDYILIAAMLLILAVVVYLDDGSAAQRWCDTYQWCEEQ
jgi:hypothetical protein